MSSVKQRALKSIGRLFLIALVACASVRAQQATKAVEVSQASADEHLAKRVDPVYPPLAKAVRVQGTVTLKVAISQEGTVTDVKTVSGSPILLSAAINAVKQWQYKPFMVEGKPADVSTVIEVPFSLGISEADYKKEQEASDRYFKQEEKCRGLLQRGQYTDAEQACTPLVELANQMPAERRMERLTAYQYAGHAEFGQKKFPDALSFYKQELGIADVALKPTEAELGYAYRDVARGLRGTGDLQQARTQYERAIKTLESAHDNIESEFLKNKYLGTLKSVLREYALVLRQTGDEGAAGDAEKKADAIVVRTDLKD
jgi:TonB family protein